MRIILSLLALALTFSLPAHAGKSNPDTGEKCWGLDCIDPEDRPDLPEPADSPEPAPTSTSASLSEACEILAQRVLRSVSGVARRQRLGV